MSLRSSTVLADRGYDHGYDRNYGSTVGRSYGTTFGSRSPVGAYSPLRSSTSYDRPLPARLDFGRSYGEYPPMGHQPRYAVPSPRAYAPGPRVMYQQPMYQQPMMHPAMMQHQPMMQHQYAQGAQQPKAKLHANPLSVNCFGPWILLKDAGIPFEFMNVDLMRQEQMTAEFMEKNPMHAVPVFEDAEGFCIWESNAIMRYIAEKYRLSQRYEPVDTWRKARSNCALDFRQNTLYKHASTLAYPVLFGLGAPPQDRQTHLKALEHAMDVITNFFLKDAPFINGQMPGIADFSIVPVFKFFEVIPDIQMTPGIQEYVRRFEQACPAYKDCGNASLDLFLNAKKNNTF
eukprot:CAMPEP_0175918690 /NCGR_PEP_ID=MMETSP0108-20121206/12012_1 /TAXON_ID=195067 ORGANISM="Goniomonas pacifica, Strain CCMP1869" /NCGR_SAMPLE_ID=MMETSP0108 /ASSEMBLY_ACC=CAM_ASM_000204 /LENGTH=344 /DNA_ID=CAMNT_0017241321 /DNA_START=9 /DNA_END=1043 /DNA_ORIENTATION=+